jgi:serine protease Do
MTSTDTEAADRTDPLAALEQAARTVADRVGAATVAIGRSGRGSGVVVAPGRVLTNAHNLRDRTTQVVFGDGRRVQGSVSGADPHGDLVVLDVDTADVAPVEWAGSGPQVGALVFAVARGLRGTRMGFGLVSGTDRAFRGPRGRRITTGVEHSAPLARGSSGGPLADRQGRLVGINTHRLGDGFYVAQPADPALQAKVERMGAGERIERPTLGVAVAPADVAHRLRQAVGLPERDGLLVRGVDQDAAADRAGIRQGDLLVRAGGRDLDSVDALFDVLDGQEPADALEVVLVRGVEELTLSVSFVEASGSGVVPDSDSDAAGG